VLSSLLSMVDEIILAFQCECSSILLPPSYVSCLHGK
jgi:hypothetical protein